MPIETLTSHQERMLERWSTAWLHSVRDTTPAGRRRAEQAIGGLCRAARRFPPVFVWVDSPLAALLARGLLTAAGLEGPLPAPSEGSFNATIPAPQSALFDALRRPSGFVDDLCRQLGGSVRERISRSLVEPLRRQDASEQVWITAYEWLCSSAWREVWCQLRDGWQGQCRDARVRDVVRDGGLAKVARATVLDAVHAIRDLLTLEGHISWVNACVVTPDGLYVVSASYDQTLKVWELASGRALATLEGHTDLVNACAVTPDGRHVVSASSDKTLKVWELATGRALATLEGHTHLVRGCAVTPDGRHVVSASDDQTLRIWDLATYACRSTHRGDVAYAAVAVTATAVAAGDVAGVVWFLDAPGYLASSSDTPATSEPDVSKAISPVTAPARAADSSPRVDIGIVTIRDDEFRALLAVFPDKIGTFKGARRAYALRHADAGGGDRYRIAMLRLIEQGHGEAQEAARDLIEDLGPRLVLVVGVASGRPSDDVSLGDVVVSTRIHDFTIEARKAGKAPTYDVTGGPIDKALAALVANLAAREDELGDWTAGLPTRPPVSWTKKGELYGPADWRRELREKLAHHHGPEATPRAPRYAAGPIASSDRLVKDPDLLNAWLQDPRSLLAIEMESDGVYRAARDRCPMLAIRGISDIVGLKRADAWTKYACASAAAFTRVFLRTRPIEPCSDAAACTSTEPKRDSAKPLTQPQPRTISPSLAHATPIPTSPMTANKILFMAANPTGTDARALAEQARAIQAELERAGHRDRFAFETRWAAQPLDLLREMVKLKPTMVHFCGARLTDGPSAPRATGVYFQAPDGHAQLVPGEALARAFDSVGSVKMVVLDACYSEHHADSIAKHIDCVVGIAGEAVDQAATNFSIGLYGGIGEGESVDAAFKQGCAAIGMTGAGDPGQPQLRVRKGVDARRLVLADPHYGLLGPQRVLDLDVGFDGFALR